MLISNSSEMAVLCLPGTLLMTLLLVCNGLAVFGSDQFPCCGRLEFMWVLLPPTSAETFIVKFMHGCAHVWQNPKHLAQWAQEQSGFSFRNSIFRARHCFGMTLLDVGA